MSTLPATKDEGAHISPALRRNPETDVFLIQCDQQPEGCGSCERAGVPCVGYRDTEQLRFYDETQTVHQKLRAPAKDNDEAQDRPQSTTAGSLLERLDNLIDDGNLDVPDIPDLLRPPLAPSIDEFAVVFCSAHYEHPFETIIPTCSHELQTPFLNAIKALALATCANLESRPRIGTEARRYYAMALSGMNLSLNSSQHVLHDLTLLSVMILANVETIMGGPSDSLQAWMSHIHGCAALVRLRGQTQLQTFGGRLLYMQSCFNVTSFCFQTGTPVPDSMRLLSDAGELYLERGGHEHLSWALLKARIAVSDIYHDILSNSSVDKYALTAQALSVDRTLEQVWKDQGFDPLADPKPPLLDQHLSLIGRIHILSIRMMLHLLVVNLAYHFPAENALDSSAHSSWAHIRASQEEILAIFPSQVKLIEEEQVNLKSENAKSRFLAAKLGVSNVAGALSDEHLLRTLMGSKRVFPNLHQVPALRVARGYVLIWAPFLAGAIAEAGSHLRKQSATILRDAGNLFSISQASYLADWLDTGHLQLPYDARE